jgi:hypothetical protein
VLFDDDKSNSSPNCTSAVKQIRQLPLSEPDRRAICDGHKVDTTGPYYR